MHTDKEIKEWVCSHIDTLVKKHRQEDTNEFSVAVRIKDKEGKSHPYTVFLEFSDIEGKKEWIVRNIVRPEQLQ
jgi:hypothetical protein